MNAPTAPATADPRRARRSPFSLPGMDRAVLARVTGAVAVATLGLACTIAWLLVLAAAVDGGFLGGRDVGSLAALFVSMIVLLALRAATAWLSERLAADASARVRANVRDSLTSHLVAVGPAGLQDTAAGDVASTVGAGVEALDDYTTKFLPTAAMAVVGPLAIFVVVAVLDPWTTPILLFAGPMLVLLLAVIGRRTADLTRRRFDELGWLSGFYLDMIGGLGTLKAFGRAREGAGTIEGVSRRFNDTTMEVLRTAFQTSLVMEWAATAATALAAVAISFRIIETGMTFGTGLAVLVLVPEFFLPFRRLALEYHAGQSGVAAIERIEEMHRLPVMSPSRLAGAHVGGVDAVEANPLVASAPSVVLRDVTYRYPAATTPAVSELDLTVAPGETVALVGPSGVGKTTVVRLLMGFTSPDSGEILVNGHALTPDDVLGWRRSISWVPQDPTLLAGTVAENIALGDPGASPDAVRRAARLARAEEFIDALPHGFATVVGERGVQLSGGQRQRIAIARAALRDAPMVVLDEFTAHLDERTERELLAAMRDLLADRSAVVVAHRRATIELADRVVTMRASAPEATA